MAHFDYIKPGGTWALLSLVSAAILQQIDRRLYKTINGDEGGVWAPHLPGSLTPTPIIIGGDGLEVTGPFVAADANVTIPTGKFLTVESGGTADFQAGSIFTLAGDTTISGPITITVGTVVSSEGDIELTDGSLTITDPATLNIDGTTVLTKGFLVAGGAGITIANSGNVTWQSGGASTHQSGASGTYALGSTLAVNGVLTQGSGGVWTLSGTHNFGATTTITVHSSATVTISCKPTLSGGATINGTFIRNSSFQDHLRIYDVPTAGGTVPLGKDVLHLAGNLGSHKTYKILSPFLAVGANECLVIDVFRDATADSTNVTLVRDDLSTIAVIWGVNRVRYVKLLYSGNTSQWEAIDYSGVHGTDVTI